MISPKSNQRGFTIIELLIATSVFSVILLLSSLALIQIVNVYYKGFNSSKTQEAARTIGEELSSAVKFTGGEVEPDLGSANGSPDRLCIGSLQINFIINKKIADPIKDSTDEVYHVLVVEDLDGDNCDAASNLNADGSYKATMRPGARELLAPSNRLTKFDLVVLPGATDLYRLDIGIAQGDKDLLEDGADADGVLDTCRSRIGSHFCATSELSTILVRRVK